MEFSQKTNKAIIVTVMMTQRREKIAQVTQKMRPNVIFCVDPKKDVIVRRSIQLGSTFFRVFFSRKKIEVPEILG